MGLKMSFTGPDGGAHPESYWNVESMLIEPRTRRIRIVFAGWHDEAARRGGKPSLGNHIYEVPPDQSDAWFNEPALVTENIFKKAYRLAKETKDILIDSFPPKEEKDWIRRGFFDDAEDAL